MTDIGLRKSFTSHYYKLMGNAQSTEDEIEIILPFIEQKIDEACKKQREICADALDGLEWGAIDNDIDANEAKTAILNAPSPKESGGD